MSNAPLTQAQTVQMCQVLQAEIRSVESSLGEVQRDVQHMQDYLQTLWEKSGQTGEEVHSLQVGLTDTNINLDKLSKELGRVGHATQNLQVSDIDHAGKLTVVEEANRMMDTRLDTISKDLIAAKEADEALHLSVERHIKEDLRTLRNELANTNLSVNQVTTEQRHTAAFARENRESLRDAKMDIENVLNEVKKTNTVANILENRLANTAKGLQQSWGKCAELSDAMVKLTECYDKTKARVIDAEGVMKDISIFGQRTREDLDQAARTIEHNVDRIDKGMKTLDEQVAESQDARVQIVALKQGASNTMRQLNQLKADIGEVKQTAVRNMGAIKETTSMLLPNIHLDSAEAVAVSERYGSLMASTNSGPVASTNSATGTSPGRPVSRKTPREKGVMAQKAVEWT